MRNSKIRISNYKSEAKTKTQKNPPTLKSFGRAGLSNTFYRAVCIVALFLMAIIFIPSGNKSSYAASQEDIDVLEAQINELSVQLKAKKAEAKTFADEVAIYDAKIHQIELKIQSTQAQIDVHNTHITDINGQIVKNEENLRIQKESLKEMLKVIYENSNTSALELIASSDNFSDFVDQSEYLQTMQVRTAETVENIKNLKQQLEDNKNNVEKKKAEIASLQKEQLSQKSELDKERYSRQLLLDTANSQSNSIQNVIANKEAEKKKVESILNAPPPPPPPAPPPVVTPPPGGETPPPPASTVPMYYQNRGWWAWIGINDANRPAGASPSYMAHWGCKITSLAMIMRYYGRGVDPGTIAQDSRYFATGWWWDLLYWGGVQSASGLYIDKSYNPSKADQWASMGKPFIASGDVFGIRYDHSVVITGKTADGRWIMNDPIQGQGLLFPNIYVSDYVFVN